VTDLAKYCNEVLPVRYSVALLQLRSSHFQLKI